MDNLETLIRQQIPNIPPQIQEYLHSDEYPKIMQDVVAKYDIHLDTASKIELQTTLLLIGIVSPDEYEQKLIDEANIPQNLARDISQSMNENVFKPLVAKYTTPKPHPTPNIFADEQAVQKPKETIPEPTEEPVIQTPSPEPKPIVEEKKIEKKYAIDPYREPIE